MRNLYIVATPIGNLEDITLRALRILGEVGLIASEDTRTTRKLLNRYGIQTPLVSLHDHNEVSRLPFILESLKSKDVSLVSEAGMPAISDPGQHLVRRAAQEGISIIPVPGPSAITTAVAISGIPAKHFVFLGFLPRHKNERKRLLESLSTESKVLVAFETPHRLRQALVDMIAVWDNRGIVICRELTKIYEEVYRGTIRDALHKFSDPRGEFTLVIEGSGDTDTKLDERWAKDELARLKEQGLRAKEAVDAVVAASGLSRRSVYQCWLSLVKDKSDPQ